MERQEIENRMLGNIFRATSGMTVGKRTAARIVGGEKKLERLHVEGKIVCSGKGKAANGVLTLRRCCDTADLDNRATKSNI